jgi:excisionase family DNA binding protein
MAEDLPIVMTADEVAEYLRIPRSSVYKLSQEGRIPCQKAGRRWRFRREAIDRWLEGNPAFEGGLEKGHRGDK